MLVVDPISNSLDGLFAMLEESQTQTVGEQVARAAVMLGRFQPPTRGHYKVIDSLKRFIRENKHLNLQEKPIVIVIEGKKTSEDKSRNPLTTDERISIMQASGKANGVLFLKAGSAFDAFEAVRRAGYEPVAVAAGSDRAKGYLQLLDKYFTAADGSAIEHHKVPGLDRDEDEDSSMTSSAFDELIKALEEGETIPDSMISGTLARYAANQERDKAFAYITGLEKNPGLAKKLMGMIARHHKDNSK